VDLKDGLKKWKDTHKELDESPEARRARVAKDAREEAARKERARVDEAKRKAEAREAALSDEEVFLRAVGAIENRSGAIMQKYDERDGPRAPPDVEGAKKLSDAQLFLDAFRDVPAVETAGEGGGGADAKRPRRKK